MVVTVYDRNNDILEDYDSLESINRTLEDLIFVEVIRDRYGTIGRLYRDKKGQYDSVEIWEEPT